MRIGIDLGGTKIEGVLLSADGHEVARQRIDTPRSYDASLGAIVTLIDALERESRNHHGDASRASVGIGIPGAIVPETMRVKNANSVWLNGQPLQTDLEQRLRRPVRIMNDANCFALSEATDGAAAGAPVVFGVILGTGVGGGVVINGQCRVGPNLIAGEWGHNPLPWPEADEVVGPPCYCGKSGCIETWLSGPGMERDHTEHAGQTLTSREIVARAAADDTPCALTLARYDNRLARALATIINVLDPDAIVLGGGMSNIALLAERMTELVPTWVFSDSVKTRIVRHMHGDSSGVRGAAWLWPAA